MLHVLLVQEELAVLRVADRCAPTATSNRAEDPRALSAAVDNVALVAALVDGATFYDDSTHEVRCAKRVARSRGRGRRDQSAPGTTLSSSRIKLRSGRRALHHREPRAREKRSRVSAPSTTTSTPVFPKRSAAMRHASSSLVACTTVGFTSSEQRFDRDFALARCLGRHVGDP
jgi:hypothetical protein